jgi:hypothetical protein
MAINDKIINIFNVKQTSVPGSKNSGTSAAKIRAYRNAGSQDTFLDAGDGFKFLVLNSQYYPRGQDSNGDCYGYIFQNGSVVRYTWASGGQNSPPPCGF